MISMEYLLKHRSGDIYSKIFCDLSTIPSYQLCQSVMKRYGNHRIIIDGIGADGVFGRSMKTSKFVHLYKYPKIVRRIFASLYNHLRLWKQTHQIEHKLRIVRRSAYLPKVAGFRALNPLLNIAYFASPEIIQEINDHLENWIYELSGTDDDKTVLPMVNNGFLSAMNQIYKNISLFNHNSYQIVYPFLDKDIVDLGLNHARYWPGNEIEKRTLKYMLAQKIHPELVYREKQGFVPPLKEQFAHPITIENLESIANDQSPLSAYINRDILKQAIWHLQQKKLLPFQTYNFLWAITFMNAWLTQSKKSRNRGKE